MASTESVKEIENNEQTPNTDQNVERMSSTTSTNNIEQNLPGQTENITTSNFDSLDISPQLKENLSSLGFTKMMKIQNEAIPVILNGKNVLAAAKTGSGKTLAFLVPAIDYMIKNSVTPESGIVTLIIAPTRELAVQTNEVATKLLQNTGITNGLSIGGTHKKAEAKAIASGINLLVATPGRLVDHILDTDKFTLTTVKFFVIDEADRILEIGSFKTQLEEIIQNLQSVHQTLLFSATLSQDISNLATLSFKNEDHVYIGVDNQSSSSTATGLKQSYIICPPDKRLFLLITFLTSKRAKGKKIMIFFSTRSSVRFHHDLLSALKINTIAIHGEQSQQKRIEGFNSFRESKEGIMICTDVAARGLDIPAVEWIIQYDPPSSEKEYIHRVGRSARAGAEGQALLFLMENEKPFLQILRSAKVPLQKLPMPKLNELKLVLAEALSKDRKLMKSAKEALQSYLLAYEQHPLRNCFDIAKLDIEGVAKSFGFEEMPQLDIQESRKKKSADNGAWIQKEKMKKQKK
ncbi:ATP-dependent RNA helicase ddx18 [Tritrichomonas musculus]|uniref:ATP-dependent RNA helicase n=1 Tax=Tritrichomonas musculus TaxID=1915356 RepID=A0ABR2KRV1_9EUKA